MGGRSFRSGVGWTPPIGLRHIVRHKGRIVAVDGAGRIKKHGPQVLLDVADFGGVIPQAVHDELDVMAFGFLSVPAAMPLSRPRPKARGLGNG